MAGSGLGIEILKRKEERKKERKKERKERKRRKEARKKERREKKRKEKKRKEKKRKEKKRKKIAGLCTDENLCIVTQVFNPSIHQAETKDGKFEANLT